MARGPWVKEKTQEGKKFCISALRLKLEYEGISFDDLAEEYKTTSGISEDDFLKSRLKPQKETAPEKPAAADQPQKSRSINGYSKDGKKLGRPLKDEKPRKELVNEMLRTKNPDTFLLIDNSPPDVVNNNDIYISNLIDTIEAVKSDYFLNNPEKIKKHPSIWFKDLCNNIKKNIPRMNIDNYSLISAVWDIFSDLCMSVGINRTIENFQIFTGLHWGMIEKIKNSSSPEGIDLAKKIYMDSRSDLVGGLSTSYGSNPNQIFIAKAVYGLTENTVVTHVSAAAETKNIDDIPLFLPEK